ncbi:PLATZ transcription factor [Haematococcus lacustris]|uniref:PLATZ transcription factor n=1 Tax=Haematococcus lacustris TaxID=44745 RepID=A0A699Z5T9_HAELA|nr:PLATZ transcription factor [Haematococcus lacustris]
MPGAAPQVNGMPGARPASPGPEAGRRRSSGPVEGEEADTPSAAATRKRAALGQGCGFGSVLDRPGQQLEPAGPEGGAQGGGPGGAGEEGAGEGCWEVRDGSGDNTELLSRAASKNQVGQVLAAVQGWPSAELAAAAAGATTLLSEEQQARLQGQRQAASASGSPPAVPAPALPPAFLRMMQPGSPLSQQQGGQPAQRAELLGTPANTEVAMLAAVVADSPPGDRSPVTCQPLLLQPLEGEEGGLRGPEEGPASSRVTPGYPPGPFGHVSAPGQELQGQVRRSTYHDVVKAADLVALGVDLQGVQSYSINNAKVSRAVGPRSQGLAKQTDWKDLRPGSGH